MKPMIFLCSLMFSIFAGAQQIDVKGVDAGNEGSTTIEIKKNAKDAPTKATWETNDGQADVEGEASATAKDAKKAWKTACAEWKKEMKESNKENKIINLNCGTASCGGDAGSKVCTSTATYKIKSKVE